MVLSGGSEPGAGWPVALDSRVGNGAIPGALWTRLLKAPRQDHEILKCHDEGAAMRASIKLLHWLPRTLCILVLLLVSLFALEAFVPGPTIRQQLGAFLIHLIPSLVLLAFLVVARKWELVGGILFVATGLGLSPFVFALNYHNGRDPRRESHYRRRGCLESSRQWVSSPDRSGVGVGRKAPGDDGVPCES